MRIYSDKISYSRALTDLNLAITSHPNKNPTDQAQKQMLYLNERIGKLQKKISSLRRPETEVKPDQTGIWNSIVGQENPENLFFSFYSNPNYFLRRNKSNLIIGRVSQLVDHFIRNFKLDDNVKIIPTSAELV